MPSRTGGPNLVDGSKHLLGIRWIPGIAPDDPCHLPEVKVFRKWRSRRDGQESKEAIQLWRGVMNEVAVPAKDVRCLVEPVESGSADDRRDRVAREHKGGDDPEVAAATADGPEQPALSVALAVMSSPEASNTSASIRLSTVSPCFRVRWPTPPPRVRPAIPVVPKIPVGTARPKLWVAWSRSASVQPGSTRTSWCSDPHGCRAAVEGRSRGRCRQSRNPRRGDRRLARRFSGSGRFRSAGQLGCQ